MNMKNYSCTSGAYVIISSEQIMFEMNEGCNCGSRLHTTNCYLGLSIITSFQSETANQNLPASVLTRAHWTTKGPGECFSLL